MPLPPPHEDPSPTSTILPNSLVQFLSPLVEEVGWISQMGGGGCAP